MASLVVLAYGAISFAFSVPVTPGIEAASRLPGHDAPREGQRIVVAPIVDPGVVATFANGAAEEGGYPGTLLVVGEGSPTFPVNAENVSLVRALAYASVKENGTYTTPTLALVDVPFLENGSVTLRNITLDLTALGGGREGFVVKADGEDAVRFVPRALVVGQLARVESGTWIAALLALGTVGFFAPLALVVVRHRPAGRAGVPPGEVTGACPECRAPVVAGSSFCMRCGAWLNQKP